MNRRRSTLFAVMLLCSPALLVATVSDALTQHDLAHNTQSCSDCHTMHYSEGAIPPASSDMGGPFNQLLLKATSNKICLFCHDGTDVRAPDVLAPVTMYSGSGDETSAGGFFELSGGTASPRGHDLDVLATAVPLSDKTNMSLTCATCHDPHGTDNFRNLKTAPAGGTGTKVLLGTDVFTAQSPTDPPSESGSVGAYKVSNVGYVSATSSWCKECHNLGHATVMTELVIPTATSAHWVAGTGSGFGVATGDSVEGIPRLRFQSPGATDYLTSRDVNPANQGICESCHFAHGGAYLKGLTWPYRDLPAQADTNSGCYQCHDPSQGTFP